MRTIIFFANFTFLLFLSFSCSLKKDINLIEEENFEATIDGKEVSLYALTNADITMQVTNFGARVVSLWVPDKSGKMDDVVYGYKTLDEYLNNKGERFLGAAIGRYGNRIANGKFTLNNEKYTLSTYNNGQCLHGGDKGFDMVVWNVDAISDSSIVFSYLSKDMEEGFPGNLSVRMIYSLTSNNEFTIEYVATTDKDTPINLTHHSFFNLKGEGEGDINDHILYINASKITPVDEVLIPLGHLEDVENTPFDFRRPTAIGKRVNQEHPQLKVGLGYDHNFVLNRKTENELELAASVYEPTTGRYMEVYTTEPAIQFYGGNFFNGISKGKNGSSYDFRCCFALETQHYPDSPNHPNFPSTILKKGDIYNHKCIYQFKIKTK